MIVLNAATGSSKPAGAPTQTIKLAGTISAAGKHRGTTGRHDRGERRAHQARQRARSMRPAARGGGKMLIGGDWGGGHPNTEPRHQPERQARKLHHRDRDHGERRRRHHHQRVGDRARQRRQGRAVVRQPDHLRRNHPRPRRRARAATAVSSRSRATGRSTYSGTTDTRAPKRHTVGTLLLDPSDILITPQRNSSNISYQRHLLHQPVRPLFCPTDSSMPLEPSNVIVTTGRVGSPGSEIGDITLRNGAHVAWSTGNSLTLSAFHDIIFEPGSSISNGTNANPGAGNLILRADNSGIGSGTVVFPSTAQSGQVDFSHSTGAVSIYYNPSTENPSQTKYQNPTDFSCCVSVQQSSQLTAYMLVNNATTCRPSARISAGPTHWAGASARPASPGSLRERRSPDCSTATADSAPVPRSATTTRSAT